MLITILAASGLYFCPRMLSLFSYPAIRRLKIPAAGFDYQSLIGAIEKGEKLIHETDNVFAFSNEGGWRNLKFLNSIPLSYKGYNTLYWLALDLKLAIENGYITWQEEFTIFNTDRLNGLSDEFLRELGAQRTVMSYWVFFNLSNELEGVPGRDEFLEKSGGLFRDIVANEPSLNRLIHIARTSDFIANYLQIFNIVEECYRIYGTEARCISEADLQRYGEYLNAIDEQIRGIFQQLNNLIVSCAVSTSPGFQKVVLQAQRDLLLLLEVISAYKRNELEEISTTKHLHYFSPENRDCSEILLELHDIRTKSSQATIRWDIRRGDKETISSRLDRGEYHGYRYTVCLDISSPASEKMYKILRRDSTHHFYLNIPGLSSEALFKMLVRIFY